MFVSFSRLVSPIKEKSIVHITHIRISNKNKNILGFSRCLNSPSSKQGEKLIEKHKILTALPEILPYPQSESYGIRSGADYFVIWREWNNLRRNFAFTCCYQTEHPDWLFYLGHQNTLPAYHVKCHGRFVWSFWRIHGYLTREIYLGERRSHC